MASYKILFKPSVEEDLKHLPKAIIRRALERIETLAENSLPPACVKLSGSERLYRVRLGDYRIVYEADTKTEVVTVHYARHRRDVYRHIR